MLNPSDTASAAALSFPVPFQMPTESPLSKLVEHCNKFGTSDSKMKLEPVKADALLLPTDMNAYSPYLTPHSWLDQTNWHHLYPTVTAASAADTLQNYFTPASFGGFLSSSVSAVAAQSAALSTQSALTTAMATQHRTISKPKTTSSSASSSSIPASGNAAGGKYQATRTANKCECPNCQEAEKFGPNAIAARKRGVHNCHIAGCGKVYNKSSHLKAHLRWHSEGRQPERRSDDSA